MESLCGRLGRSWAPPRHARQDFVPGRPALDPRWVCHLVFAQAALAVPLPWMNSFTSLKSSASASLWEDPMCGATPIVPMSWRTQPHDHIGVETGFCCWIDAKAAQATTVGNVENRVSKYVFFLFDLALMPLENTKVFL